MSPAERLMLSWSVFKPLAIKVKGRLGAARFLRDAADVLEAEQRIADQRDAETNVISLAGVRT